MMNPNSENFVPSLYTKEDEVKKSSNLSSEFSQISHSSIFGLNQNQKDRKEKIQAATNERKATKRVIKPLHLMLKSIEQGTRLKRKKDKGKERIAEQIKEAMQRHQEKIDRLDLIEDRNQSDPMENFDQLTFTSKKLRNLEGIFKMTFRDAFCFYQQSESMFLLQLHEAE